MQLKQVATTLSEHDYPVTSEELAAAHGEEILDYPNGSEPVREVFDLLGPETYDSPEEARTALYSAVSHEAIGRKGYSDRDTCHLGTGGPEHVSF